MPLFWLFPALILIEIAAFVMIGSEIGVGLTLLLVLGSTALGVWTLRRLGLQAAQAMQSGFAFAARGGRENPVQQMGDGTLKAFASGLLIVPGLVSSALGAVLLIPAVRQFLWQRLQSRLNIRTASYGAAHGRNEGVIDGEFTEVDTRAPQVGGAANENSVWRQHPQDDQK
ncbi:FxsA cytoplasmic membrane protein [Ketogulonicigenium vulgare Y25]|uniref:FxsA protein, putative n=2 Tax=Ketogulonicigenium vulgare TaxID=92945 RepID=F9Y695_KETVW|nr:FxsA family protein [Ketogulonicigenium vulgare]ADO43834.1 FxsA cytoplasmic membrane protein [Ketogulonicigenium vulgare Y25]AEM42092.1 FxsA protein, putative [Ketogulonicigenium vulgare WSH-001]ALJ79721.1 exlusion protein FxsA [Ketogulonicigenium vulgare]AOZ55868.1 FxsA cytoplasmic membrane protein [Ketogulonicigenium vulgare]